MIMMMMVTVMMVELANPRWQKKNLDVAIDCGSSVHPNWRVKFVDWVRMVQLSLISHGSKISVR